MAEATLPNPQRPAALPLPSPAPRKPHRKRGLEDLDAEALESFEDWTHIKRLARYLRPHRRMIILSVALSIFIAGLQLLPGILAKPLLDDYIAPGNWSGVALVGGILFASMVVLFAMQVYVEWLIARTGQYAMRDLRMDLFRHLQKQSLSFFDKRPVGWLITRLTSDVNVLNELFAQGVVGIFQQLFMLVGILVILLIYNVELALWTFLVIPPLLVASWIFRNQVRLGYRLTRLRLSRLNTHTQENVSGMRTVQANTREHRQYDQFEHLNDLHRDAHYRTVFAFSTFFPAIEVLEALALAVVVWRGGLLFIAGEVSIGELLAFVLLFERFFAPVRDLSEKFNLVQSAIAASERLFKIFDTPPSINDPANPVPMPPRSGTIEFRDVWFAYGNAPAPASANGTAAPAAPSAEEPNWVLKGVSFKVERGQKIALIGPTGSGKTTLMSLLCRFYEIQKGQILVDGVDIRDLSQQDLRRKIAIVLQDVFLFRGTVADNIRLGSQEITDERIEQVARAVNADLFVQKLPQSYESRVMERGATLSVGQKQLLSFARALAFDPEILILDEATSNIDTETEQLIQDALKRLVAGRTSLIIAHRLSTIQACDKILVLHHGHLVEEGTHKELLERDGLYRRLYELQ